jgi:hypothetical protein
MSAAADLGYYNNALDEVSELLQMDINIGMLKSDDSQQSVITEPTYRDKSDEIDAILQLYENNLECAAIKYNSSFIILDDSIYRDLHIMDLAVDGIQGEKRKCFNDPFSKCVLIQHVKKSRAAASRYDDGICELLELISNDLRIGAAVSREGAIMVEEQIISLRGVDEEIEKIEVRRNKILANKSKEQDMSNESKEVISPPIETMPTNLPVKRGIFSKREKDAAVKANTFSK